MSTSGDRSFSRYDPEPSHLHVHTSALLCANQSIIKTKSGTLNIFMMLLDLEKCGLKMNLVFLSYDLNPGL